MNSTETIEIGVDIVRKKLLAKGITTERTTDRNTLWLTSFQKIEFVQVLTRKGPSKKTGIILWKIKEKAKIDYMAVLNLEANTAWLFSKEEFLKFAQHRSAEGVVGFFMRTKEIPNKEEKSHTSNFKNFLI